MKTITSTLLTILTLSVSFPAFSNLSYDEITKDFKIGESYFLIMEGYNLPGVINRTGQYACGAIAFTDTSTQDRLDYTFKAWMPDAKGKCHFQDDSSIQTLQDFASLHTCVSTKYQPSKVFDKVEIEDTKEGNRAIELTSNDGYLFALSRCLGTVAKPANINTRNPFIENDYGRDPFAHTNITEMIFEDKAFAVLEDESQAVKSLKIQLSNAWNYVILKDQNLN